MGLIWTEQFERRIMLACFSNVHELSLDERLLKSLRNYGYLAAQNLWNVTGLVTGGRGLKRR